ncbi:catabolite repressor/activator [Klebsiella pneumoniae]|nr:catabolite repressor/activator [Klebsiella pneumoniae]
MATGASCWTHTFYWSCDPHDLENASYTRIANYLERQARQRGYQLLIACSEDQPDNEMRCIEHQHTQRQVDAIIVSTSLPPEHPFYQLASWANDPFPIVALDRALDREHFTSVVGADQDDAEMLAEGLRKFPAETVLYLGALPELSVSFLREQGFRTAWKDDPREVHFLYANSYEREAAAQLFEKWLETHPMPQALFLTSFALLQGVMDVTLRRDGKLPSELAIATFGDNELLDFLQCPVLAVAQRHRDVAERVLEIVLASLDEPRKPKPGLSRIRRNLYRRGSLNRR